MEEAFHKGADAVPAPSREVLEQVKRVSGGRSRAAEPAGRQGLGVAGTVPEGTFRGDDHVLCLGGVCDAQAPGAFQTTENVHLRSVHFTAWKFYIEH